MDDEQHDYTRAEQYQLYQVFLVASFHFGFRVGDLAGLRLNGLKTTANPWWSTLICFCRAMSIAFAISTI